MEQSLAAADQATQTPSLFSFAASPGFSIRLTTSTTQQPSLSPTVAALTASSLPMSAYSTTMSPSALRSIGLNRDPPATGPAMPATQRLRAQVMRAAEARTSAAAAVAAAAAAAPPAASRRSTRSRNRIPQPSAHTAVAAAASAGAPDPPRRSTRTTRKRAPAAASTRDDPPTKKRKANLKSAPVANAKSDDDGKADDDNVKTASCCICMDEPKPADLASINGCEHLFCFECIEKWSERENTCPLCKVRFTKIDRVNKTKRKKGESAKNTKKVKQKDQRSDIAPGAALEGLLASFANSANFPPHRVARLIFSGMGVSGNPFAAVVPGSAALRSSRAAGAAAAERQSAVEDSLFSSDTDDDEDHSFLPAGAGTSFADLFRAVPVSARGPVIFSGSRRGVAFSSFGDPPTGRSYASNGGDRNAGRQAENPLEIEDSEDEEDIEVVQVTRPRVNGSL